MFKDKSVSKGCRVSRVPRVYKEILDSVYKDTRVFRAYRVSSVPLVVKVPKVFRVFRDNKVSKDFRVCKV